MGFAADVATLTNRRLKFLGEPGYLVGVLVSLARLRRRPFPLRAHGERDDRRCLFVAFSNSKYTGGKMMIAPQASIDSGTIEYVHWGPIGRLGLVRNLPTLFTGTHIRHPMASRRTAARIDFELKNPVDVVVDGEVLTLEARVAGSASRRARCDGMNVESEQPIPAPATAEHRRRARLSPRVVHCAEHLSLVALRGVFLSCVQLPRSAGNFYRSAQK